MGAIDRTPKAVTTNSYGGSIGTTIISKISAGAIVSGSARGLNLGEVVPLGSS